MKENDREIFNIIVEKLKQQLYYYQLIHKLTSHQREAIKKDNTSELIRILSKKQKYMDKIDNLQNELLKYHKLLGEIKKQIEPHLKDQLRSITNEISGLLKKTVALENENMRLATEKREMVACKINSLKMATKVVKSYRGVEGPTGSRFMDRML